MPLAQTWPAWQAVPHAPQLEASLFRFTQLPPHSVLPGPQGLMSGVAMSGSGASAATSTAASTAASTLASATDAQSQLPQLRPSTAHCWVPSTAPLQGHFCTAPGTQVMGSVSSLQPGTSSRASRKNPRYRHRPLMDLPPDDIARSLQAVL